MKKRNEYWISTKLVCKIALSCSIAYGAFYVLTKTPINVEQVETEVSIEKENKQPIMPKVVTKLTYQDKLDRLSTLETIYDYQKSKDVELSSGLVQLIKQEMNQLEQDQRVSFLVFDLKSAKTFAYHANSSYYGASTIKGAYVPCAVSNHPDVMDTSLNQISYILSLSDNDMYKDLFIRYPNQEFVDWCKDANLDESKGKYLFTHYSSVDLAKLWVKNDQFFKEDQNGERLGVLFEDPYVSPIQASLKKRYTIRSKAGWINEGPNYNSTSDAGIIYDESPYIMVVMSNYPAKLEQFETLIPLLDTVHKEMVYGPIVPNKKDI